MATFQLIEEAIPTQPFLAEAQRLLAPKVIGQAGRVAFDMSEGVDLMRATAPVLAPRQPAPKLVSSSVRRAAAGLVRTKAFLTAVAELQSGSILSANFIRFSPAQMLFPEPDPPAAAGVLHRYHLVLNARDVCRLRTREAEVEARTGDLLRMEHKAPYMCLHGSQADAMHLIFDLESLTVSKALWAA